MICFLFWFEVLAVTRDVFETCFVSKQRVSPFYHDLDLDLVGLVGKLWLVQQLAFLVVEQLLNPIPSSNHVSRKSLEEAEVTHILLRI